MKVSGGRNIYGVPLGILMLESAFPRIRGDMGNARTWPFPVSYRIVKGASPHRVVRENAHGLYPRFRDAALELQSQGVGAVTTNCGFLVLFQADLEAALDIPVLTSTLLKAATIQSSLPPGKKLGILTISAETLTGHHLRAAAVPHGLPVVGVTPGCELQRVILGNENVLDVQKAERDMVEASKRLVRDNPDVAAILFECTNMPPYAGAVSRATGLPVHSSVTIVTELVNALPGDFG